MMLHLVLLARRQLRAGGILAILAGMLAAPTLDAAEPEAPALPKLSTKVAFPNLKFERPVSLDYPNDGSNLLFVIEQHDAKVWSFPNDRSTSDKQLFLELPDPINRGNEEGLLGLAFHPKYKENGQFFVYYSAKDTDKDGVDRRSVVSRFTVSKDDPRKADPSSEKRIWQSAKDPFENHNGGCIAFGPDGFLYISLGDSGAADDPLTTGQNPRDWWGSILRVDVDHPESGKLYGIPKDNPARSPKFGHWAPEVYCIGLRNVWKFSFDRKTGDLWAGDVGQNLWEMVHLIKNGGNYGWSIREAFHPFQPQRRQRPESASKISPPIAEYPHSPRQGGGDRTDDGKSITGGYVYRGKAIPSLEGVYVYGDYDTGRIWGLREKDGKATVSAELIDVTKQPKLNIAGFAEDPSGELLILAFDKQIHELVPANSEGALLKRTPQSTGTDQ
ncbi:PQQ-dependent sugar dehydrogenase [Singulisphaera sp. PoT]|uniref:PQQ-dependent sugar dehydrogenase n=1 Tax=Singulisphaera sp. PoT TaxID=3411797 RepID=UPI003BF541D9